MSLCCLNENNTFRSFRMLFFKLHFFRAFYFSLRQHEGTECKAKCFSVAKKKRKLCSKYIVHYIVARRECKEVDSITLDMIYLHSRLTLLIGKAVGAKSKSYNQNNSNYKIRNIWKNKQFIRKIAVSYKNWFCSFVCYVFNKLFNLYCIFFVRCELIIYLYFFPSNYLRKI